MVSSPSATGPRAEERCESLFFFLFFSLTLRCSLTQLPKGELRYTFNIGEFNGRPTASELCPADACIELTLCFIAGNKVHYCISATNGVCCANANHWVGDVSSIPICGRCPSRIYSRRVTSKKNEVDSARQQRRPIISWLMPT